MTHGRLGAVALAGLVAGCVSAAPPPTSYQLSPKSTYAPDLPRVAATIAVETPTVSPGLGTQRIALQRDPAQLEYYAGATWVDVLPVLVRARLIQSFDNSDRIDALGADNAGARPDYVLTVNIRHFEAVYPGGAGTPETFVALDARLLAMPRRQPVGSRTFSERLPASGPQLGAVVAAFDDTFGKATKDLVDWAVREIAAR